MAKSLLIPKGSPVRWVIQTGTGTISEGLSIRDNEAWEEGQRCGRVYPHYCQPFDCADFVTIQVTHENTDVPDLFLEMRDSAGDLETSQLFGAVNGNIKEASISMAMIGCGACYNMRIVTPDYRGNIVGFGNNGTFDVGPVGTWGASTGGNNTITHDLVTKRTGLGSARIDSNASPSAGSYDQLWRTADYALLPNTYYEAVAYIRDSSANPYFQNGDIVYFFASGFADMTQMVNTYVTPSVDGRDTWLEVRSVFRTGADVSGTIRIACNLTPQGSGQMWIDDWTFMAADNIVEALSGDLCIDNQGECVPALKFYADFNTQGFDYESNLLTNELRIPGRFIERYWEDPNYTRVFQSAGTNKLLTSKQQEFRVFETAMLPWWYHRIIAIALKHQYFLIGGFPWLVAEGGYKPEPLDNFALTKAQITLINPDYDQDYTYE